MYGTKVYKERALLIQLILPQAAIFVCQAKASKYRISNTTARPENKCLSMSVLVKNTFEIYKR